MSRATTRCHAGAVHGQKGAVVGLLVFALTRAAAGEDGDRPLLLAASVAKVRVELGARIVVTQEVNLSRDKWRGEDQDVFVAFGAPGVPRAIDVHLVPVAKGHLEAPRGERGVPLSWSYERRRPASASPLLGRSTMAGIAVRLPADVLARALAPGDMAALRIRSVQPAVVAGGSQDLLVRLGDGPAGPLVLGRLEVVSDKELSAMPEARFCGQETSELLAIRVEPASHAERPAAAAVVTPRRAGADLCLRLPTLPKR